MEDILKHEIEQLFELVHTRGLDEVAITRPDFAISVVAIPRGGATGIAQPAMWATALPADTTPVPEVPIGHEITSPLVGIFYRASSPDNPVFVEIGDTVEVGQTIGIVEAMKVFNEITADVAGTVLSIPTENGKLVQPGQTLVVLDTGM